MPRSRAFDDDDVRQRVADVFTAHGYHGTTLSMLTGAAGLGKQSLYNAFGDKRELYLHALDCAIERTRAAQDAMAAAASGRAAIEGFFAGLLEGCTSPDPAVHTCIVSAGLLEGIAEPEIAARLRAKWQSMHQLLARSVERGQRDGSIRADIPAAELCRLLMTLMSGLRVTARALDSARQLRSTMQLGLRILDVP